MQRLVNTLDTLSCIRNRDESTGTVSLILWAAKSGRSEASVYTATVGANRAPQLVSALLGTLNGSPARKAVHEFGIETGYAPELRKGKTHSH